MSWSNFQKMVDRSTSGKELYRFFIKRDIIDILNAHLSLLGPIESEDKDANETIKEDGDSSSANSQLPVSSKEPTHSCIELLIIPSSPIECC